MSIYRSIQRDDNLFRKVFFELSADFQAFDKLRQCNKAGYFTFYFAGKQVNQGKK